MRVIATKSLIFWPCACWSEGCFFDHWRSDMAFPLVAGGCDTPDSQKAPSTIRCIKTRGCDLPTIPVEKSESTEHHKVH